MAGDNLAALAAALNRPEKSLYAFGQLAPAQIAQLTAAVAQVCERQRGAVRRTLPQPVRWFVLKITGGTEP